jgi:single-strand DNA-binding protein
MPNYNNVTMIGHLGKDPELKFLPTGTALCSFSLAVNNRQKVEGEWKDVPMWFKVRLWGKSAEKVSQSLSKGSPCLVNGRLSIEQWTSGEGKNMTSLVIDSTECTFLGDRPQGNAERPRAATAPAPTTEAPSISDDDIPF